MTAGGDQPKPVVFHRHHLRISVLVFLADSADQRGEPGFRDMLLRAQLVDRLPPGGNRQPRAWFRRHAIARPRPGRRGECFGHGILGGLQVAEPPRQRGHDRRPLLPVGALQRLRCYCRGARHAWPSTPGPTPTLPSPSTAILPAPPTPVPTSATP